MQIVNKILSIIGSIPKDKLLHFITGVIIALFFGELVPFMALASSFIGGVVKEIYDEISYGGWDWYDLLATVLGGLLIQIFILV